MNKLKSVCVFCGSKDGAKSEYAERAFRFGQSLADNNIRLVYGGGNAGLMGLVARGCLKNAGKVTGIIPEFLIQKERASDNNDELDELIVTQNMHERKMKMFEVSDAFVALPGGIGTLEELVEQITWAQLGQHRKPILLADFESFWEPFVSLIDHMTREGFVGGTHPVNYLRCGNEADIVGKLRAAIDLDPADLHDLDAQIGEQM